MTRQQFSTLVERNQVALRRYLVALCGGDKDVADDIAQETLMKAYLSVGTLNDISKFKSWLFRIAYHTFINDNRSNIELDSIETTAVSATASEEADSSFRYQHLYLALNKLNLKERGIVVLFYLEGYSSKEIAEIIKEKDSNVRQLLSRARKSLKTYLEHD